MEEMRNSSHDTCEALKTMNVSINEYIPEGVAIVTKIIPVSTILFFGVFLGSTMAYLLLLACGAFKGDENPSGLETRPSFRSLLFGKVDEWIREYRGEAYLHYFRFLRLLMKLTMVASVISSISVTVNYSQSEYDNSTSLADNILTSISILSHSHNSNFKWFNVIASILIPPITVLFVKIHLRGIEFSENFSSDSSRTVLISNIDPEEHSEDDIREYLRKHSPAYKPTFIVWARRSVDLRKMWTRLNFLQKISDILSREEFPDRKKLEQVTLEYERLSLEIHVEKVEASVNPLPIVFISFEERQQADRFLLKESLNSNGRFSRAIRAPLPEDIMWENLIHPGLSWIKYLAFNITIIVLLFIWTTPSAFMAQFKSVSGVDKGVEKVPQASVLVLVKILSLLVVSFNGLVTDFLVLKANLSLGGWDHSKVIRSYIKAYYCWLIVSGVILPMLTLTTGEQITNFLFHSLEFLQNTFPGLHFQITENEEVNKKVQCMYKYMPDSGIYFLEFIFLAGFLFTQIHLHRIADLFFAGLAIVTNFKYIRNKEVVRFLYEESIRTSSKRNGNTMSSTYIAAEYCWILSLFSIMLTFCISTPLITLGFIVMVLIKYTVDVENMRRFYHTPAYQPAVTKTALKIIVGASVFPLLNCIAFLYIQAHRDGPSISNHEIDGFYHQHAKEVTLTFFFIYATILLILQSSNWRSPIHFFDSEIIKKERESVKSTSYVDPLFFTPVPPLKHISI